MKVNHTEVLKLIGNGEKVSLNTLIGRVKNNNIKVKILEAIISLQEEGFIRYVVGLYQKTDSGIKLTNSAIARAENKKGVRIGL
jgi:hypothetical protein